MKLKDALEWMKENKEIQFAVKFIKKDKTIRIMNCMTGIQADLIKNPYRPGLDFKAHDLVGVYDTDAKEYRCFSKDKLLAIKINNQWQDIDEMKMKLITDDMIT